MQKLVLKNQFGEEAINFVLGSYIPLPGSGNIIIMNGATAPVDGTTGDNIAGKGSLYIAQDTGALYIQTSAITTPVWTVVEAGSASVLATVITGYVSGAGSVSAADTILTAINKLNGNTAACLTTANFTSAAVTAKVLTGLASGANSTILSTDTILVALAKLQAQIDAP